MTTIAYIIIAASVVGLIIAWLNWKVWSDDKYFVVGIWVIVIILSVWLIDKIAKLEVGVRI